MKRELELLFQEIGSKDRVHHIMLGFYERMAQDTMIGFFFAGKNLSEIAARQAEFLLKAMGESRTYSGLSPAQAHEKLAPILPGHFDRRTRLLEGHLKDQGLSPRAIQAWLDFEQAFRAPILAHSSTEKR
ncbi:MAG: hypothetical protein RJB38_678 [Pseudomonadota bacterium]|jgi:truncated hemoglobin YjbI